MSITANNANYIATMLENVDKKFPTLSVKEQSAFSKKFTKAAESHQVSTYSAGSGAVLAYRIPVELAPGGDQAVVSLNGGDLGTGSGEQTASMTLGTVETSLSYNIPARAIFSTGDAKQAISNAMKRLIGGCLREQAVYDEIALMGDGTGILAQATAIVSGDGTANADTVYQLETTSFGWSKLFRKGMLLDIANGSNVILAANARLKSVNFSASQVTITAGSVGYTATATDQMIVPGMGAVSDTITSGSYRAGIYTYNTTNTSGSLNGLAYATAYELACPNVNSAGAYYSAAVAFAGRSAVIGRRDDMVLGGMIGVCSMAQRVGWYLEGVQIANQIARPGEALKNIDTAGQGTKLGDTFEAADMLHHVSRYANKTRVDWFLTSNFGYVEQKETGFYTTPDGQRMFNGRSATTGNPTAGTQFYVVNTRNLYSVDPGASCVIYNNGVPPGQ